MNKHGSRILFLLAVSIAIAINTAGQARSQNDPVELDRKPRVQADETFELNVSEKHFTELDFEAGTSVGLAGTDQDRVSIQVGVAVRAQTIKVDLRNVTGTVRFRGSVQRILDLVQARRTGSSLP